MARWQQAREERAQNLVEFALIMPVLFLLLFGILDGGRVFAAWMTVTNEAREGARFAVADAVSRTPAVVDTYVRERTKGVLDPAKLTVATTVTKGGETPTSVRVDITYQMTLVTPLIGELFPKPVLVKADSVMRAE